MKRRVLAMILSMAMVFTMLPATTLKAEEGVTAGTVRAADSELGTNLALSAKAEAGYTNVYGISPDKINDGTLANGNSTTSWNSWGGPESGYPLPVTLTWSTAQTMSSMRVMWWSDGGGVTWPSNATLEYKDGEDWKPLPNVGVEHGETNGQGTPVWNIVNFDSPITTTALRMKLTRNVQGDTGVGISEWEVYAGKIKEELTQAKITGSSKLIVDEVLTYNGSTVPEGLASQSAYKWSVAPADVAAIQGADNKDTVDLKGLKEGAVKLKLSVSNEGVTKETEFAINVREDKVKSIDVYKTSTAAGVAPILPDSVVANGIQFDDPTPSLKSTTKPDFDFAEEFNSKLIPVTWEKVDPAKYAKGKEGTSFRVSGTATHGGKSYSATAMITVKDAVSAAESNSSVTFENVQLNDVFWAPKQEVNAKASLKKAIYEIEQASGGEPNYDNSIKKLNGEGDYGDFSGYVFQDSDIYKSIEAISYTLSATQNATDPEMVETRAFLAEKLNSWIEKIEKVQYADGYIDTYFTLRGKNAAGGGSQGTHRWLNFANHEMYNAGHFLEGVVAYTRYREGIGEPDYRLYVAGKRFADHIVATFGPAGTRHEVPGHEEIELAMVKFGKLAEEYEGQGAGQDYYDTVRTLINRRGEDSSLRESGYEAWEEGKYSQDKTPFKDETEAVGHSVRANYFYTGITDIATMLPEGNTDREDYLNSLDTIWESVTSKKTYITGGIGTTAPGASSEGYGPDYVLPPNQSYAEICASIAAANWNQRMNLLHEDGKYADMIETNLYNSILVGTNLDGNRFYYSTLLEASNGNGRSPWFGCACCPPNLMRTIAAASGYMYTVHNDTVFVNMYAGSEGKVNVGGTQVGLKQETEYPWEGTVKMTVTPAASKKFTMKIRIPGWVNEQENKNVTIKVGNETVTTKANKGYVAIDRTWQAGDVVQINMPMEIRKTESHPLVESTQGKIALQRGPVVYCMEKAGNAQLNPEISNFNPLSFVIPRDAELTAEYKEDLLNGVVEITGDVKYNTGSGLVDAKLQAIPYYAWNNRGDDATYTAGLDEPKNNSSKMLIWTTAMDAESEEPDPGVSPDDGKPSIPSVTVPQLRDYATPTAAAGYDANAQGPDKFKDDTPGSFWNGWTGEGPQEDQWIQYDFGEKKVKLSGSTVDFYDDGGGVVVPNGIKIEYAKEDGSWAEVTKKGEWNFEKVDDVTYRIESAFEEVETSKIRVTADHKKSGTKRIAIAVFDWKLTGDFAASATEKKELTDQIANVEEILSSMTQEDYITEGWNNLQSAITAAKAVAAKNDAGLVEIREAQKAVADAYSKLDKKADAATVQSLQTMVTDYKAQESQYSAASWTEFKKTLDAAEALISSGAGKSEINAAKKALETAAKNLDAKADTQSVNVLKSAVAIYDGKESEYTAASWAKFKPAYDKASSVANSNGPGQNDVDEAMSGLAAVESKLDKKASADAVNELKAQIDTYHEADYSPESWKRFVYTLDEVKAVCESEDPGEKMINAAKTSLDTAKLKLEKVASSTSSDKLNQTIQAAGSYKESEYTAESWAAYMQALETVKNALAAGETSQAMIDELQGMLEEAAGNLQKKGPETPPTPPTQTTVDKKALNASITAAAAKKQIDYTPATWTKFTAALTAAQNMANNANATQAQVNTAKSNLDAAVKGLVVLKASSTKKVTLGLGETYSVKTKNCTYLSSDANVATVDAKGTVKAKKVGTVVVKAIPSTGNKAKVFNITIKKAPNKISKVTFNKKAVKKNKVTLKKGKKGTFKVTLPKGTASNKITYTSSKKKVATVSKSGVVKAKKKGTTTITIKTFNKKTKKIKVTVK